MKLPQNSRNFSRKSIGLNSSIRLISILVIASSLVFVLISVKSSSSVEDSDKFQVEQNRSTITSPHLKLAASYTANYLGSQSESDAKKAQKEIEAALENDPNNGYALRLLKYFQKIPEEDVDQEIVKTQEILKQRPDYAAAWLRLALLYQKIGAEKQADEALKEARQLNGD